MAIINEHENILKFMSGIHEPKVIKLRNIRLVARTRKLGHVYRIVMKKPEAISNLIMDGILVGK